MIVAVDIGTSSCKGCGFDEETLLPLTNWIRKPYEDASPRIWYETCLEVLEAIVTDPKSSKPPVVVVLSGMMQNVILPHEERCIPYNDATYAWKAHEHYVKKGIAARLKKTTGNYKDSASIAAKLHQLQYEKKYKKPQPVIFGAHSYVAWRLLNIKDEGLLCDPTTASTTGLIDSSTGVWIANGLIKSAGLTNFIFPRLLQDASRVVGHVFMENHRESKLNGLPLIHGSGDLGSLVAAVDQWGFSTHAYLGTSGWIARVVPKSLQLQQDVFVLAHPTDPTKVVHAMPTTCAGFNASKWAKTLCDSSPAQLDIKAGQANVNLSSVIYLPYLKGERAPVSMPQARAAFLGLTGDTSKEDMALAVLCGVAYQFRWLLDSFDTNKKYPTQLCLLGGGSGSSMWKQVFSDVLNAPVRTLNDRQEIDETVWGAACIAVHGRSKKLTFPENMWIDTKPRRELVKRHDEMYSYWHRAATDLKDLFSRPSAKL